MFHSFFYSADPLKKAEYFFRKEYVSGSFLLGVRPVCIVGDLEILHDWMNDTHRKTNWKLNAGDSSLFRHYGRILKSENSQSLIIEKNRTACIQFDIVPVMNGVLPSGIRYDQYDYVLNFLFRESFRDPQLLARSLEFLIECLNYLSEIRFLYLKLIGPDRFIDTELKIAGFEEVHRFSLLGIESPLYRLLIKDKY